jgi:hypothetical protein
MMAFYLALLGLNGLLLFFFSELFAHFIIRLVAMGSAFGKNGSFSPTLCLFSVT